MSKYHHAPKQAWQTGVFIQFRYGLSSVILFIFLIILNIIWIYYTITFCRFTFCFYILMAKQTNQRKWSVFNETHLQKIFFENWRTTKLCGKKERTSEQCHEFVKKIKNRPMLWSKIVLMILFIRLHFVIDRSCTTIKLHISSAS